MNPVFYRLGALLALAALLVTGCASTPSSETLTHEARATLSRFVDSDPELQHWADHAYGYAVFPKIAKGGFWVGGGFGRGIVFEQGQAIGRTSVSQATIGPQIGAQSYSQIIFFEDQAALTIFRRENLEFSAQATAVAVTAGAAATTSYERGVAVFILIRGGLMAEVSIGGQKYSYLPL